MSPRATTLASLDGGIWSVTARLYCLCGDALHTTGGFLSVVEKVAGFWNDHDGDGHGPTEPDQCRAARKRRERRGRR